MITFYFYTTLEYFQQNEMATIDCEHTWATFSTVTLLH